MKNNTRYKIFSIPIETKNRELLGKLLLSATACKRKWAVFIGQERMLKKLIHYLEPGVIAEISIPEYKYKHNLLPLIQQKQKIVNICEEGVIYPDGQDYCDRKVGVNALKQTEKFFATGSYQANHVSTFRKPTSEQLVITGNPRFDVLRPKYRSAFCFHQLDKKHADLLPYILINTNFARFNPHPDYTDMLATLKSKKMIAGPEQETIWRGLFEYQRKNMVAFKEVIPELASRFDCKVVIRPHPSENHDYWRKWAKDYNKVFIYHEGNANEWIISAQAIIHNSCTTGLEGFMLGKPVIAYVPEQDKEHSKSISNQVSLQVHSQEQLYETVSRALTEHVLDNEQERQKKNSILKYYIENVDGPLASERIVEELNTIDIPSHSLDDILRRAAGCNPTKSFSFSAYKALFKKGLNAFRKGKENRQSKVQQKFSGLSEKEIMEPLLVWQEQGLLPSLPRVVKISDNLFCLYQE